MVVDEFTKSEQKPQAASMANPLFSAGHVATMHSVTDFMSSLSRHRQGISDLSQLLLSML